MRKLVFLLIWLTIIFNDVSGQESEQYKSLFNGKDLTGWLMPGEVPGFEVQEGIIKAVPPNGSDLFTEDLYGNYKFKFDYYLSEVGNSGVLIRCDPTNPWETGVEIQLLAPWTPYRDDLHCTASLYGHVAVTNRPDETTNKWHTMEIICDRNLITVSVDGKMATHVDIDTVSSMDDKLLAGAVGFQSNHSKAGEFAYFRNIQIVDFDSDPEYVAEGFANENERFRKQALEASVNLGISMIDELTALLEHKNTMVQAGARQALFDIVAQQTNPDSNMADKQLLITHLKNNMSKISSKASEDYLLWLAELAQAN